MYLIVEPPENDKHGSTVSDGEQFHSRHRKENAPAE